MGHTEFSQSISSSKCKQVPVCVSVCGAHCICPTGPSIPPLTRPALSLRIFALIHSACNASLLVVVDLWHRRWSIKLISHAWLHQRTWFILKLVMHVAHACMGVIERVYMRIIKLISPGWSISDHHQIRNPSVNVNAEDSSSPSQYTHAHLHRRPYAYLSKQCVSHTTQTLVCWTHSRLKSRYALRTCGYLVRTNQI
jgi:hypothetical protein